MTPAARLSWDSPAPIRDIEALRAWVRSTLSADELEALQPEFSAEAIAARRDAERDTLIAALALSLGAGQREQARQVHEMLGRYAASAWRFDRHADRPHKPENFRLWQIMRASGGKVWSDSTLRRILRSHAGSREALAMNQRAQED